MAYHESMSGILYWRRADAYAFFETEMRVLTGGFHTSHAFLVNILEEICRLCAQKLDVGAQTAGSTTTSTNSSTGIIRPLHQICSV